MKFNLIINDIINIKMILQSDGEKNQNIIYYKILKVIQHPVSNQKFQKS